VSVVLKNLSAEPRRVNLRSLPPGTLFATAEGSVYLATDRTVPGEDCLHCIVLPSGILTRVPRDTEVTRLFGTLTYEVSP